MQKKHPSPLSRQDSIRRGNNATLNAFSRVLAVLIFLIIPGVVGSFLDRWLGTSFLILIGFLIGMFFAVAGMLYVVKMADLERRGGLPGADLPGAASLGRETNSCESSGSERGGDDRSGTQG